MRWFGSSQKPRGFTAVGIEGDHVALVQARAEGLQRPLVTKTVLRRLDPELGLPLDELVREFGLRRSRSVMLLQGGEYQLLLIEAPKVAPEEVKLAARWQVKDLLDLPLDDVTIDVLDVPVLRGDPLAVHSMYVVAAPNTLVRDRMERFDTARAPLHAIDIAETAQRNVSSLYEDAGRSCAFVHVDEQGVLLTITCGGELYFARRSDIPLAHLVEGHPDQRELHRGRLLTELQRSLDHFERQYRAIPISKLVLSPLGDWADLDMHLADALGISIETADLRDVLEFEDTPPDIAAQTRLFHVIGAALRDESVGAVVAEGG